MKKISKHHANLSIRRDIWFYWSSKDVNMSRMIERMLENAMLDEIENTSLLVLEKEIDEVKNNMRSDRERLADLVTRYSIAKEKEDQEDQEEMNVVERQSKAIKAGSVVHDIFD
jgi:hypothetical protein